MTERILLKSEPPSLGKYLRLTLHNRKIIVFVLFALATQSQLSAPKQEVLFSKTCGFGKVYLLRLRRHHDVRLLFAATVVVI